MKFGLPNEIAEEFKFKSPDDTDKNKKAKTIKISVNSGHYKLVSLIHSQNRAMPSNFFSYGRWFLFALFIVAFAAEVLSYFVYGWVVFAMNFPQHGWDLINDPHKYLKFFEEAALMLAVTLTGVVAFFSVLVGVIWGIVTIVDFRAEAKARRCWKERESGAVPKKPKEPGLVRQWLKAKKEKMCPMIEYVDE